MLRAMLLTAVLAIGLTQAAAAATLHFHATLNGATEVPPHAVPGTGELLATLDTKTKVLTYTLTFQGLTGPATMAHFHGPAKPGANAGVVVPFTGPITSPFSGTATLTDAQIKQLTGGLWYANVHTAANPGGEIRGQVLRASD
jgi:hypothetical protein